MTTSTLEQSSAALPSRDSLEKRLDNISGQFEVIVPLFQPGSLQHADQVTSARVFSETIKLSRGRRSERYTVYRAHESINTVDIALYCLEEGTPVFYLGHGYDRGELINPFLKSPDRVASFLKERREAQSRAIRAKNWWQVEQMDDHYHPTAAEAEAIKNAKDTIRVRLADVVTNVHPKGYFEPSEHADFEIDTRSYDAIIRQRMFSDKGIRKVPLNESQRLVAERVFGQGDDFKRNMRKLRTEGIKDVELTFLFPGFVASHADKAPIAGECWISDANMDEANLHYDFFAIGHSTFGRLVGMPKVDYGPIRSMLRSKEFSPEGFSAGLPLAAVANIAKVIEGFMSYTRNASLNREDHPYERHGQRPPRVEKVDYEFLAQVFSSPEFPLRMEANTDSVMAESLFKTLFHNAYFPGRTKSA